MNKFNHDNVLSYKWQLLINLNYKIMNQKTSNNNKKEYSTDNE